jgi:hypothetical protein
MFYQNELIFYLYYDLPSYYVIIMKFIMITQHDGVIHCNFNILQSQKIYIIIAYNIYY